MTFSDIQCVILQYFVVIVTSKGIGLKKLSGGFLNFFPRITLTLGANNESQMLGLNFKFGVTLT